MGADANRPLPSPQRPPLSPPIYFRRIAPISPFFRERFDSTGSLLHVDVRSEITGTEASFSSTGDGSGAPSVVSRSLVTPFATPQVFYFRSASLSLSLARASCFNNIMLNRDVLRRLEQRRRDVDNLVSLTDSRSKTFDSIETSIGLPRINLRRRASLSFPAAKKPPP